MKMKEKIKTSFLGPLVNIRTGKLDANANDPGGKYPFFTCAKEHLQIDRYAYDCECVLVAGNGDLNAKYYKGKFNAYQRTYIIETKDPNFLNVRYLYYFLDKYIENLRSGSIGGVIKYIKLSHLTDIKIPIPSIPEQKRVAAILDKADAIRRKRGQAIQLADEFLRSVFLDMFGNVVKNTKNWEVVRFGDVCETRLGKMLDKKQQTGRHLRQYLRNANVLWDAFFLDELSEMDFDEKDREEFRLRYGDILICEGGEVGRSAIWRDELQECYFQKALHRVRPDVTKLLPEYVVHLMRFYAKNGGFQDHVTSVTIPHLTGIKLKNMKIPLPPLKIQKKFSDIARQLDATKEKFSKSSNITELLFNSLTHRAFRGEL